MSSFYDTAAGVVLVAAGLWLVLYTIVGGLAAKLVALGAGKPTSAATTPAGSATTTPAFSASPATTSTSTTQLA